MEAKRPRCSFCEREAVISLPYARLRLCEEHLEQYLLKRIKRVSIPKKVIVGLTGGKDSVAMTYLLRKLGIEMITVTVDSVPYYTREEAMVAKAFADRMGLKHVTIYAKELYGFTALSYKWLRRKPCSVCSMIRRHAFDLIGHRIGVRYVATGHNMDDVLQVGLHALIFGDIKKVKPISPVEEPIPGSLGRVKPLFWIPERDVMALVLARRLPWLKVRCPLYDTESTLADKIRMMMHEIEDRNPSSKLKVLRNLMELSNVLGGIKKENVTYNLCKRCGLISQDEICTVCKIRENVKKKKRSEKPRNSTIDIVESEGNVAVIGHGWIKWVSVMERLRGIPLSSLLNKLGLNREIAVAVDADLRPIPYDARLYGEIERGELTIFVVTRISPKRVKSISL